MPELLNARVEACYVQAEAFFQRAFTRPEISLRLRGQKAGVAHLDENLLRFNLRLYQENRDDFLTQTVAHEVAHMIARQLYGARIQPHGAHWQAIMGEVYALPAQRCHSYAISRRPSTRYVYHCQCANQDFAFSAQRHRLASKGRHYLCRRCRGPLVFSGQQRVE